MPRRLLIDTDVLIDYLRGQPQSVEYLENLSELLLVSAIIIAELYGGVREGKERKALDEFVRVFEVVPINDEIAVKGGLYRRDYFKSHNVGLADAIIAATSDSKNASLVTLNQKHFPMFKNVIVPYQKS